MKNNLKRKQPRLKAKSPQTSTMSGEPSKFSWAELNHALLESFDLMQRVLLDNKYVVVGEAARCLKENRGLDCDGIDVIIERRYVTPEVVITLRDWATPDVTDQGFVFQVGKVPVRFRFIDGNYDYFKFADLRVYGPEQYRIPNQWKDYWEHRDEIK